MARLERGALIIFLSFFVTAFASASAQQRADANSRHIAALTGQAEKGEIQAQYELGRIYYMGVGVRIDYGKAEVWFRKAAEKGDADSQFMLGGLYHFGQSVPHDEGKAFLWVMKAAQQGHGDAEFFISTCYSEGWGVAKNDAQSIAWLRKGAEQGHLNSQFYLGWAYEKGEVVPRDYSESYFWLELATTGDVGDRKKLADIVELRDESESHLTQSELSEVRTRLQKWVKEHPVQAQ